MKKNGKTVKHTDKRTRMIRIVAWILVLMTVVTTLYTAIYFIMDMLHAADEKEDISVAVGLLYGSDADVALTAKTTNGFKIGSETIEQYKKTYTELWSVPSCAKATVLCDKNYELKGTSYKVTDTPNIGAYRLDTGVRCATADELSAAVASTDAALAETDYYSVPAYINGEYALYIGAFLSAEEAQASSAAVSERLPDLTLTVKEPSSTGTFAVEHETGKALFAYDCGGDSYMAFDAIDNADGTEAYLTTFNDNLYDGVFVFKRTSDGKKEGITLITVVPLEQYIMGVVPYEVSSSWPMETLKAFSIIARTFVVDSLSKHYKQYGFNVCSTSNCQVYRGVARVNDRVRQAVMETAGQVTSYNGKMASIYYCSSMGNCTADVSKVWGSKIEWMSGVVTPWEAYKDHKNAFWTAEISPAELCSYLNSRGYTQLKDEIASVTIDETASDISTFVCGITVTDIHGNSVKITRCDKVRSAFSKYVNSANFVIGKGSVEYTEYTETVPPASLRTEVAPPMVWNIFSVITGGGVKSTDLSGSVSVLNGNGTSSYQPKDKVSILTADGTVNVGISADSQTDGTVTDNYIVKKTMTAEDENNFIIVGKGWGHGVGVSQWGIYDLAYMGADCLTMINAYCPGLTIGNYKELINY